MDTHPRIVDVTWATTGLATLAQTEWLLGAAIISWFDRCLKNLMAHPYATIYHKAHPWQLPSVGAGSLSQD